MTPEKYKYKLHGRFKGRKKLFLYNNLDTKSYIVNFTKDIDNNNYNILDIGSGSGENAIYLSNKYPDSKIFTCDLFQDGNINLQNKIYEKKIKNIFMFQGNVLEFLDKLKKKLIFNQIWILFPDPWPKIKHHKRRLINDSFINHLSKFHKKDGKLYMASDSQSYIESILLTIYYSKEIYSWKNQRVEEWNYSNLNLADTKFYKKALKNSRISMFFDLFKI